MLPIEIDQGFLSILLIIFAASAFKTLDLAGGLIVFFTFLRLFETCKYFVPSPLSSRVKAAPAPSTEEKEIEMKEIIPVSSVSSPTISNDPISVESV